MTGGGAAGECDQASGVLAQFEILDMIANGNTPIYDGESETYWFDTVSNIHLLSSVQSSSNLCRDESSLILLVRTETW